jgi:hypothetical protein
MPSKYDRKFRLLEKKIASASGKDKVRLEREFVSLHIRHHVEDLGMGRRQAVAVALSEARKKGYSVKLKRLS